MIHTTMTRQKVLRLAARGWFFTVALHKALYVYRYDYYEVGVISKGVLHGNGYNPVSEYVCYNCGNNLQVGVEGPDDLCWHCRGEEI